MIMHFVLLVVFLSIIELRALFFFSILIYYYFEIQCMPVVNL